ncbi:MAG TPA: protein kinase, partial [Gemmatimonadaceae bacterium]
MTLTGVIDDRYSIEREIGRGGMATVYLARDIRHGNRVALKILTSDFASMVSGERFTREIRITAGLQHPNILPVFDSGQHNGHPYYVMPFVDGPTLSERIKKGGALAIDEALEIAGEVADALAHAHAEGIVHRDIKPSNILLAHGHAVVADFGVARALEPVTEQDLTRTGIAVGTAAYMSPEQAAGEIVDGRSDVYSLGCVLYEMIAGHPPYTAPNPRALMAKHWMDEIPSLRAVRSSVRSSIEALVRKAMAKRPAERFATAAEMEAAIRNVSTEERLAAIGFTPSDDQPSFSPPALTRTALAEIRAAVPISTIIEPVTAPPTSAPPPTELVPARRIGTRHVALAAAAVAVLGVAAWQYTKTREPKLDRNRVLVYPLLVPDDFKGSRNVGEDIGTMIGTALDGAGQLRWIDGWPLLTPAIRQNIRNLSGAEARAIARSRRAAWYLAGRIVSRGDSSEVFLELNDVEGDSTVARGRASGLTSDAWRTGLHAVNSILPVLIPPGTKPEALLAEWADRDPSAVASFLLGESAFRRVHLTEALQHYRNALQSDSTFGLAAIRGAQAAAWNHRSEEAASFIDAALRGPMSPRYTHFARGYQAYLAGAADSAAAELRRSVAIDPEMSAAWMQLGEVYVHLLPFAGHPDSLARVAFDEAFRVDSSAKNSLLHSIEIRLRAGDVTSAAP